LEISSNTLIIDFTAIPGGEPTVESHLNMSRVFDSPIVGLYVAALILQGDTLEVARTRVVNMLNEAIQNIIINILQTIGVITIIPSTPPLNILDFQTTLNAVAALCGIGGAAGNRALITRNILRNDSSGTLIDKVGFCLNNTSLLRDFIRPRLTARFSLTNSDFDPIHPFRWSGSVPLPPTGIPLISSSHLLFITAGIDEAGSLHVIGSATAAGIDDAFSVNVNFDLSINISATTDGATLTINPAFVGLPTVNSDPSIAWWVYLGAALSGGVELGLILGAIDLFGGAFINGPISNIIMMDAGTFPSIQIPLSVPGLPPLVSSVSSVSLHQGDAANVMFTVSPGRTARDGFRGHDLIITMI
jgi:hypothetical protein